MSHQSGIRANEELLDLFMNSKKNKVRIIVVRIVNEQLQPFVTFDKSKDWQQDYAAALPKFASDKEGCYILVNLGTCNAPGDEWLFITFAPDCASVRQRMLYASTRATLKSEFGAHNIKYDIQVSSKKDLAVESVKNSCEKKGTVLSIVEYGLLQAKLEESSPNNRRLVDSPPALKGVMFPIDQEAIEKLELLAAGDINYVQLSVDTLNEAIKLELAENIELRDFHSRVPRSKARYHFLAHGDEGRKVIFIYTIPPSMTSSIKDRMLYSSCKAAFLDDVERTIGLNIVRKIEADSAEKFDEHFLLDEFYPSTKHAHDSNGCTSSLAATTFSKPQGPKNQRGNRRINKVEA